MWTITDPTPADAEERLVGLLNEACLALLLSVGHRTGLLDALAAASRPLSIAELAERSGQHERYVREWLGGMTVGRIVAHDPDAGTYRLPEAHANLLTTDGDADLASYAQYIAVLGAVEDRIVDCFARGGGVPYEAYPRLHEVLEEDSAQTVIGALDGAIVPLVPGLTERLDAGIDVLDVGCGRGRALATLATRHPRSRFVGLDLSTEAIEHARSFTAGLDNVEFVVGDAALLPTPWPEGSFDLVTTFDAVHDQADPAAVVAGIRRLLRDDGVYLAQDIDTSGSHAGDVDHPLGPFIYTISTLHCMTVSLARSGAGLGAAWGRPAAEALLHDAGFGDVTTSKLPHDDQNAWYVAKG